MASPDRRRASSSKPSSTALADVLARESKGKKGAAAPLATLGDGPGWWEDLSPRVKHALCLALLFVVGLAFTGPALFSGKHLGSGDAVTWRMMAQPMLDDYAASCDAGSCEEPLWNTNAFAGMPGYMVTWVRSVPGLDTVLNVLRKVMWPLSHWLVLFAGVYALVWYLTRQRGAAVLSAIAFGLTAYLPLIVVTGHNTKFIALCFVPWVLLAFIHAIRKPSLVAGLLFAVAFGLNVRANHPQITYYVLWTMLVWWIAEIVYAVRRGEAKRIGLGTAMLVLGGVLGAGAAAHPMLLNFEFKKYTLRDTSGAQGPVDPDSLWRYAMAWSQGIGEMVTTVVAGARGMGGATYWGPKTMGTGGPHYFGGVTVLLAVVALAVGRRRYAWPLGIAALLMTLFSFGENLPALNRLMFNAFPLFNAFRVPETWLSVVAAVVAVLAGLGVSGALRTDSETKETAAKRTQAITIIAGVFVVFAAFLYLTKGSLSYERPGEREQIQQAYAQQAAQQGIEANDPRLVQAVDQALAESKTARQDLYAKDALRFLVLALLGGLVLVLYRRGKMPAWAMQASLAALVLFDLYGVGRRSFNKDALTDAPAADNVAKRPFDDFLLGQVQQSGGKGRFRVLDLSGGDPTSDAHATYFYENLGGYTGAKLRVYQDYLDQLIRALQGDTTVNAPNLLALTATRYVVAQGLMPSTIPAWPDTSQLLQTLQSGQPIVGERPVSPRAWFVGEVVEAEPGPETWMRLNARTFEVYRTAIVPPGSNVTTTPLDSANAPTATVQTFGPRRIVYDVSTNAPRLLVMSEVYYPAGWTATADGKDAPILRVNHLLRGVLVPAGAKAVEFRFDPPRYATGMTVAWASTLLAYLGLALLLGLAFVKRRKGGDGEAATEAVAPEEPGTGASV